MFVRRRVFPSRIKLVASNFAWWFINVLGRESHILRNFAAPETQKSAGELASTLTELLIELERKTKRELLGSYGPGNSPWRQFGGKMRIYSGKDLWRADMRFSVVLCTRGNAPISVLHLTGCCTRLGCCVAYRAIGKRHTAITLLRYLLH